MERHGSEAMNIMCVAIMPATAFKDLTSINSQPVGTEPDGATAVACTALSYSGRGGTVLQR